LFPKSTIPLVFCVILAKNEIEKKRFWSFSDALKAEILEHYETHLHLALARTPSTGAYVNVMFKMMGYFSHQLSREEKLFFLESIDRYRAGRLALSANLSVLRAWIVRFKEKYLMNQTFLEPYPEELIALNPVASEFGKKDI
jgi:uncharacterized protein YbgA (DUF1722 family)